MRTVKRVAIGLVVLSVAVAVTFYAILQGVDTERLRGEIEAQAQQATGRKLRLAGPIDLSLSLDPAVVVQKVTLDNADWGSRPALADIGRLEAQVELLPLLQGRYVINRILVADADILLETSPQGEVNWALPGLEQPVDAPPAEGAGAPDEAAEVVPEIGSVVVRDSRLVYRDGATGESLLLTLDSVELTPDGRLVEVDADGSYQEVPFQLTGRVGGLPMLLEGGDLPVELTGRLAEASFAAEGRIVDLRGAATPDLRVELEADSLAQFDKLAGAALPDLGPLALSGRLGLDAGVLTLDELAVSLGGSDLAGSVTTRLQGPRPALLATLTGERLDFAELRGGAAKEPAISTAPGADGGAASPTAEDGGDRYVFADAPLPLAVLQALDAELELKLGELVVDPETVLTDLDLAARLENGRLEVSRLTGRAFEGQFGGSLGLDAAAAPPPVALRLDVVGLSVGQLMKAYAGSEELQTSLDLALDLEGAGDSPRAIAASLDGSSELIAGEGVITNRVLAVVASGLDEILGPLFGSRDKTRLNCLVSRFRFEDGVAVSQAQLLDSSTFSLAGTGRVDLNDETLDLKFDTRTREAALVSLAVPFVVSGTLAEPEVSPDALGTALKAAEFVEQGGNPLAALGRVVSGEAAPAAEGRDNGCVAALEQTADEPAGQTPDGGIEGKVQEGLDKLLQGEDPKKALDDALGGDSGGSLKQGIEGLFKRD